MNISFIILLVAFVILFAAYVKLARVNKRRTRPYSWVRSDKHMPKTKRQVLLFIDADVPDGSRDTFRYRTAIVDEDENGNKITRANEVKVGDTVYPNVKIINTFDDDKTALLLITEYNSLAMTNANYAAYNIPAGTSRVITNQIPLIVRSLNDLAINGYIWEGFDSNKPLTDMVVCD